MRKLRRPPWQRRREAGRATERVEEGGEEEVRLEEVAVVVEEEVAGFWL